MQVDAENRSADEDFLVTCLGQGAVRLLQAAGIDSMDPACWGNGSPEAAPEEAMDLDGNVDLDSLTKQLASANA